jgi:small-conductance mechanosensitive channel
MTSNFINLEPHRTIMGLILDESIGATSILEAENKGVYLLELLKPIFSKVLVAVIVLLIGFIIGKLAGKILQWFLRTLKINKRIKDITGTQFRAEQFLSGTLSTGIYFIVIIMALTVLGMAPLIVTILSIGIIVLIFAMVILSIKDFVPNYVDGFRVRQRLDEGDKVIIKNVSGRVQDMTWTDVKIIVKNGDVLYIPNSLFLKEGFKKVR